MSAARFRIHDQVFWYSTMAIAFFLPVFGRVVPSVIGVMVLNWLIDGRFIKNFSRLYRDGNRGWTFSFALFYLLYVSGLLYTSNFEYAWFDLEIKLSLFIFPLIFATSPWPLFPGQRVNRILWSFVAGCVVGAMILLGHAAVNEFSGGIIHSFYYMKLAWYFHTSYLSMYYNFVLGILLLRLLDGTPKTMAVKACLVILSLFFLWMIFLLISKAGMLTMILILLSAAMYAWIKLRLRWAGMAVIGAGLMMFLLAYLLAPVTFSRVAGAERVVTSAPQSNRIKAESNADRLAVWKVAGGIIKKHFLFGVGTGDVKDALLEGYRENKVIPALEHKFNAHSQYLQTFVTLGLTGFLLLLATLLLPAIRALRRGQAIYLVFLVIFAINILFESMLEIQQGVVFYAFLNILLFTANRNGNPVS
jgi:O-antigen ligase